MLIVNANERISWEDYFKHPFFKINKEKINLSNQLNLKLPSFNLTCKEHSKELIGIVLYINIIFV